MCLPENPVFLEIWLIPWYFQFILNKIRLHSFKKNWFFGMKLFSLNPANLKSVLVIQILIKFSMNPARFSTLFFKFRIEVWISKISKLWATFVAKMSLGKWKARFPQVRVLFLFFQLTTESRQLGETLKVFGGQSGISFILT